MTSNLLSRWRPPSNPATSIYETIRQHDDDTDDDDDDVEERAAMAIDERNLREEVHDVRSDDLQYLDSSRVVDRQQSTANLHTRGGLARSDRRTSRPRWMQKGYKLLDVEEADDNVPASLLIEGNALGLGPGSISLPPPPSLMGDRNPMLDDVGGTKTQGEPSRARISPRQPHSHPQSARPLADIATADPREIAMWRWTNVTNLDNFLLDVYTYYSRHGFWSILFARVFGMLTSAFIVGFSLFLTQCVNYRDISSSTKLSEVVVPKCASEMGFVPNALLWLTTFVWICKVFQYAIDFQRLRHLHDFYLYLLNISEDEIQSISWQEIVSRLMALRDSNPNITSNMSAKSRRYATTQNKQRMDAHDIANRLMRRENYFIAMVNKEILDTTLPIPFLRSRQLFTHTLEWNLSLCIMDFVFNDKGQIRPLFLKDTHRKELSETLRRRFVLAGTANLVIAPFLVVFFLLQNFFQYFNEYQKNPAQIGSRQYNPLARWKFREFNELWHLFERRINMSHPFATRYINQFPKDKTIQIAQFVTFISGAIVSVLGLATIFDQENFLSFEITNGRTTIFYLGLFGGVWAVARGLLPDENMVYEPAFSMQEVIEFTHYQPAHWNSRLHTVEVKKEFEQLYQMKIIIFIEEILSMVFTPFVLWFSLPKCSDRIIDFFREFTVHVDGIGYVCSFAEFKLRKPGDAQLLAGDQETVEGNMPQGQALRDDYFASKDHKLEQSYWGFMNDYARNPKTDVRFPYNARRRLNMPPPAPGLLSPTMQAGFDQQNVYTSARPGSVFSPQRAMGFHSATPNFAAQSSGSPLQSLLLDPHHQPSASGFGGSQAPRPRGAAAGLGMSRTHRRAIVDPPADVAEEGQEEGEGNEQVKLSEGELGSWKYDDEKSDTSEEEDALAVANNEVGVVGLIRQFQRAQGDSNRNSSGI